MPSAGAGAFPKVTGTAGESVRVCRTDSEGIFVVIAVLTGNGVVVCGIAGGRVVATTTGVLVGAAVWNV